MLSNFLQEWIFLLSVYTLYACCDPLVEYWRQIADNVEPGKSASFKRYIKHLVQYYRHPGLHRWILSSSLKNSPQHDGRECATPRIAKENEPKANMYETNNVQNAVERVTICSNGWG